MAEADRQQAVLKVGPLRYRVVFRPLLDEMQCKGRLDSDRLILKIDPDLPLDSQRVTLMHEILHACFYGMGLHNLFQAGAVKEEQIADMLDFCLVMVLRDNPWVVEFLTGEVD